MNIIASEGEIQVAQRRILLGPRCLTAWRSNLTFLGDLTVRRILKLLKIAIERRRMDAVGPFGSHAGIHPECPARQFRLGGDEIIVRVFGKEIYRRVE